MQPFLYIKSFWTWKRIKFKWTKNSLFHYLCVLLQYATVFLHACFDFIFYWSFSSHVYVLWLCSFSDAALPCLLHVLFISSGFPQPENIVLTLQVKSTLWTSSPTHIQSNYASVSHQGGTIIAEKGILTCSELHSIPLFDKLQKHQWLVV